MAPPNHGKCSGCRNTIQNREFLECAICKMKYDINCANIPPNRFYSFYAQDPDRKRNWKCPECCSKQPKLGNTNTPIHSAVRRNSRDAEVSDEQSRTSDNVTIRSKRDCGRSRSPLDSTPEKDTRTDDYVTETKLRSILQQELKGALKSTMGELVAAEIKNMSEQIRELKDSMAFFNTRYEDLKSILEERNTLVEILKSDNDKLKSTVSDLTNRLHLVEQNMRDSNIEINGIPEHKQENLTKVIEQLAKTIDAPVTGEDILHITRAAKMSKDNSRPRSVIVKLRAPRQRDAILASVSSFNKKNNKEKLHTQHLGLGGPCKPVFVSEHLSPTNKSLHAATRLRAKECNYKFTWVRNGRIFVRKDEFSEAFLIRNMDSLGLIK